MSGLWERANHNYDTSWFTLLSVTRDGPLYLISTSLLQLTALMVLLHVFKDILGGPYMPTHLPAAGNQASLVPAALLAIAHETWKVSCLNN